MKLKIDSFSDGVLSADSTRTLREEFGQKASHKQLCSNHHGEQAEIKQGALGHFIGVEEIFCVGQVSRNAKSGSKDECSQTSEEVHGSFPEFRSEGDRQKIKVAFDEAAHAILGASVFTLIMRNHLFCYLSKTGPFGNDGDVAVHLALHLNAFDEFASVGFQSAIEIVQGYAADYARGAVKNT